MFFARVDTLHRFAHSGVTILIEDVSSFQRFGNGRRQARGFVPHKSSAVSIAAGFPPLNSS